MKAKMLTETAYPPPPPPPQSAPPKNSRKLLVVALLLVIVVASAGVLFYLATRPSSTNPTPTPTATPTGGTPTSPTATPTSTPSGNGLVANFRAGAWANYTVKDYDENGGVTTNPMSYSISDGTYNGVACLLMRVEMQTSEGVDVDKMVMTYWMNKNTLDGIHVKTQMYTNGNLTFEHESDISPGDTGDMPEPIDMSTVTSQETITVPAGTFSCGKVTTTSTVAGITSTTSMWANSNVPILGLVKQENTSDGVLSSAIELIAYGG